LDHVTKNVPGCCRGAAVANIEPSRSTPVRYITVDAIRSTIAPFVYKPADYGKNLDSDHQPASPHSAHYAHCVAKIRSRRIAVFVTEGGCTFVEPTVRTGGATGQPPCAGVLDGDPATLTICNRHLGGRGFGFSDDLTPSHETKDRTDANAYLLRRAHLSFSRSTVFLSWGIRPRTESARGHRSITT